MKKLKNITIKTGSVDAYFDDLHKIMGALDKREEITSSHTVTFVDPRDMLQFLSPAKMKLIETIRKHPDTLTNIAETTKRHLSSVSRDIRELEKFGLVKIHKGINPGHGHHKIIEIISPKLKLEAYI